VETPARVVDRETRKQLPWHLHRWLDGRSRYGCRERTGVINATGTAS